MKILVSFPAQLLAVTSSESVNKQTGEKKTYYKAQVFLKDSSEAGELNLIDTLSSLVPGNYSFSAEINTKYDYFRIIDAKSFK